MVTIDDFINRINASKVLKANVCKSSYPTKSDIGYNGDSILVTKIGNLGRIYVSEFPSYCGGVFLHGMNNYGCENPIPEMVELLDIVFKELKAQNQTFVSYISTKYQSRVNGILEQVGFQKSASFINPNTNNEIYHWYLDLNKK